MSDVFIFITIVINYNPHIFTENKCPKNRLDFSMKGELPETGV